MKTYIIGNWKMNFTVGESSIYLDKLTKRLRSYRDIKVVIAPSVLSLQPLSLQIDRRKLRLSAQNCHHQDFGAFTGEFSASQLRGIVDYVIIGHSERRRLLHESDRDIRRKVASAIRNGITPILCIGEDLDQYTYGETRDVLRDQLLGGLSDITKEDLSKFLIAYEPIWAISTSGTARLATPDDVANSVSIIRSEIKDLFHLDSTDEIPVLYGGSVNPSNAGAYLTVPEVNGLLVGGASLIADQFIDIIETAKRVQS